MRTKGRTPLVLGLLPFGLLWGGSVPSGRAAEPAQNRVYYVRQTLGDDSNDGLSPATAWQRLSRLSRALTAGDTAYVGPGLYREELYLRSGGTSERPIMIIGDAEGRFTGDPPGVVMVTGAEPIDENIFQPHSEPGVWAARLTQFQVVGAVEMDGRQLRYLRARSTREHLVDGLTEIEAVAKLPASYHYEVAGEMLYLHTSDGAPPASHEIELMRRGSGIAVGGKEFVTVQGFTFRHTGDAGIIFGSGSNHGMALNNVSYGHRQGIRVNNSKNVLVAGNTLFRNENSGTYFLRASTNGRAIGNTLYENVKGLRWSSESNDGVAVDNTAFDNLEAGLSIESTTGLRLARNRLIDNGDSQLLVMGSRYQSEANCFARTSPQQMIVQLSQSDRFDSLAGYQRATGQDRASREGGCGSPRGKIDVQELHHEAMDYVQRARQVLGPIEQSSARSLGD